MTKERVDIHQHITDKIASAIERGAVRTSPCVLDELQYIPCE